jgi:hypothetical protein
VGTFKVTVNAYTIPEEGDGWESEDSQEVGSESFNVTVVESSYPNFEGDYSYYTTDVGKKVVKTLPDIENNGGFEYSLICTT